MQRTNWADNLALELKNKIAIARLNKHQLINQGNKMSSIVCFEEQHNEVNIKTYATDTEKERVIKLFHQEMERLLEQNEELDHLRYVLVDFDNATSTVYELSIERIVKYELTGY